MEHEIFCEIGAPEQWSPILKAALGSKRCNDLSKLWTTLGEITKAYCRDVHSETRKKFDSDQPRDDADKVLDGPSENIERIKADKTTTVQTVIMARDRFKDVDTAAKWITEHGYAETKTPDETEDSFRFRQEAPEKFVEGSMRTIELTDGVKAVIGRLKVSKDGAVHKEQIVNIEKVDEQNRIVYGVVLDPYIVDSQDDNMTPSDVEKTAHRYMEQYRKIGLLHEEETECVPVQSFIVPYPSREDYAAAMADKPHAILMMPFGDGEIPSGSWVLGTKINDDEIWKQVQSGELGAYSIGGYSKRREMEAHEMPVVTKIFRMST